MKACIGAAALAATLVLTAGAAVAQYVGPYGPVPGAPFRRDFRDQQCPGNYVYQGGSCVDPARRYTQEPEDWRKRRERQLDDRQRTSFDRDRDQNNWRVQRQQQIDDRYGADQPTSDRRARDTTVGTSGVIAKPLKSEDCIIRPPRPPRPGDIEASRPRECDGVK
jgi:hypothetical protein